ncbi:MAG: nuclear transport factor 2 family protein [Steroidobacteraceae bacterium]
MQRAVALLAFFAMPPIAIASEPDGPLSAPINLHPGAAPASQELIDALAEKDRQLFDAVFGCQLDMLATLVADDFEFFHDKWGQTANSGQQFVDAIAQGCERQKTGSDFKARRELVPESMTVHVLNNYGAMQMGTHRFFALRQGQPDRLTETGKFIDLWKNDNGTWKLARVISYEHQLADASN